MKIFLTGITGYLGRHIAKTLVIQGHSVIALVRNPKVNSSNYGFDVELIYGELSNSKTYANKLNDLDVIIHCAANAEMGAYGNKLQENINIKATQDLLSTAKKINIKRFIYISTANTIAPGTPKNPGKESQSTKFSSSLLNYIKTKIIAEELLLKAHKAQGFPVVILNPTFMLGPQFHRFSSTKLIHMAMNNKIKLCPSGGKNIVDVRDVATAVVSSIDKGECGEKYLLCNTNHSYREVLQTVSKFSGSKAPKYNLPKFLGTTMGVFGSFIEAIVRKPVSVNHKSMKILSESHYYSHEKAKAHLDFAPRPAEESIIDTIDWIKNWNK